MVFRCPPSIFGNVGIGQKSPCFVGEFVSLSVTDLVTDSDTCAQGCARTRLFSGIHSAQLNGEATIFRRRYYHNGGHTGGMIYCNDPNMTDEVEEEIISKLEQSKGIGNLSTMFVNIPKGDPDGIKFIPIGNISAKDEFQNIKSISARDVLTAHRFPAGLAGIIPTNGAVMGDIEKAAKTYRKAEILPIQRMFTAAVANQQEIPQHLYLNFLKDNELEGD